MNSHLDTITLGGGCFWCLEAVFEQVQGVISVESGYCNGHVREPSYEAVCSGHTGHAEVVRLRFDPELISLRALLEIFFVIHDPTTLNRQGHDVGTQYRSGIYLERDEQRLTAQEVLDELARSGIHAAPLVTEIEALSNYWPAEDYHQHYYARHPEQGYCALVISPKLDKFQRRFAQHLRRA